MNKKIYKILIDRKKKGIKSFAVLIDPDKIPDKEDCQNLISQSVEHKVDLFFLGGSLITHDSFEMIINAIKECCDIPVILFPGNNLQIHSEADGILLLSLISGRNPEYLIGQHVVSAPILRRSELEILSTGYILVDSGRQTAVSYMSNTKPIPSDKPSIAVCTAMAGEMLGLKLMYLDGGSGALDIVPPKMITKVKNAIDTPLIVGGGLNSPAKVYKALEAGADVIVVGNGIEKKPDLIKEVAEKVAMVNSKILTSEQKG